MNQELETLLKAYDQFTQAHGTEAERLFALYESLLGDSAERSKIGKDALHKAVRLQYLRWVRASNRQSSLPPKA